MSFLMRERRPVSEMLHGAPLSVTFQSVSRLDHQISALSKDGTNGLLLESAQLGETPTSLNVKS